MRFRDAVFSYVVHRDEYNDKVEELKKLAIRLYKDVLDRPFAGHLPKWDDERECPVNE